MFKYAANSLIKRLSLNYSAPVIRRTFLTANFPELKHFPKEINSYEALHKFSIQENELFWSTLAKSRLEWIKPFTKVREGDFDKNDVDLKWFSDGKLNVSVNCVDRHYLKNPNKIALIWEKDEPGTQEYVSYKQLYELMNKVANMLKDYGVKKGDRVAIYMPTSTMTVAVMLACVRIGAVHSVVFAGFSSESLASRINDSECKVVFTANQSVRGGKTIDLKKTVDAAVESCPTIKNVFVYKRTDASFDINKEKDVLLEDVLNKYPTECKPEVMDSEDPLFMLYTSGSTGKPKGLVHTQAGYLLQVALSHQLVFNYKAEENEVFGCLADVGWITGHSYVVYGPLCNGGTTVLFESTPIYPNPGRYWETVDRLKINQLYLAPTSLRLLHKFGNEWVKKYSRETLKCLGSVGEPINHEAWHWYTHVVGDNRCKIADTWWQTETGSQMITPLPCNKNDVLKPSMAMRPFLGVEPILLNEKGQDITSAPAHTEGILCIKKPWPSLARSIYGDKKRYLETYFKPFPGYYFTGDGAFYDKDKHLQITGRVDDVINVSGHRIGTAEIEDVLDDHEHVAESAVVGYSHAILGEGIFAYIILREDGKSVPEEQLINELKQNVKQKIAGYAVPHGILITPNLPKTRSGKIMRRVLRKIAENKPNELGDLSTLLDPSIIPKILDKYKKIKLN